MHLNTQPRILIVQETDEISSHFSNWFLQDSDALIMKCNYDIIRINQLINSYEPDYLVVNIDVNANKMLDNFDSVNIATRKECKVIFISKLDGLKEKLMPLALNMPTKHFEKHKTLQQPEKQVCKNEWVGLPTNTGIRFANKTEIVLFRYSKKSESLKEKWEVLLASAESFQLKVNTTSKDIFKHFSDTNFIQLCQKCIVNIKYIHSVETKTHKCLLHSPFEKEEILISRSCLNEIKERFDV